MITISEYERRIDEGLEINEGLFSGIKRRKALRQVSAAAQEYYDALIREFDIEIDKASYQQKKEFHDLSRAAQLRKIAAFDQKARAAQELVRDISDKCSNMIAQRRDDDEFYRKAYDIVKDAEVRARKEQLEKADSIIRSKSIDDLRTDWDEFLDKEHGSIFGKGVKVKNTAKESLDIDKIGKENWKIKHKVTGTLKKVTRKQYDNWESIYWEVPDKSDCYEDKDGEYWNIPTEDNPLYKKSTIKK